jgi:hypothetical protein
MTKWLKAGLRRFFCLWACGMALSVHAQVATQEGLVQLDIGRGDARLPVYVMPHPQATATLILLPGGDAGTGKMVGGQPQRGNFLSRSRSEFFNAQFNVMVAYRPSDLNRLEYSYRVSKAHVAELDHVIAYAQEKFGKPVWLVGTSRGTVSGTAAAIALGESQVQGLVLTSSVTSKMTGAVGTQNVASLKIPVVMLHHKNDACHVCVPSEAERIIPEMKSAPVKKFIMIEGGSDPQGEPCEAKHWHGFINYEKETVKRITDWIQNPQS